MPAAVPHSPASSPGPLARFVPPPSGAMLGAPRIPRQTVNP